MSELKPCPICDGPATYVTVLKIAGDYSAAVICERCNAKTDFMRANDEEDAKVMAAACWNARAERTCKQIYPNDSDFRKNPVARCSECMRPLVKYESGELANFCHFCGARVVEQCAT